MKSVVKVVSILISLTACSQVQPQSDSPTAQSVSAALPIAKSIEYDDQYLCRHITGTPVIPEQAAVPANTIWEEIPTGFQLDWQQQHPRIQAELNWYLRNTSYLPRVSERARRYVYYVSKELAARNMPQELALLPIVESAYDPFAYSHGRAAGMWQFIPGTARVFNMRIDWWYDGRRDIVASTQGAIRYLEQLHKRFDGDWLLALAAYNSGQGTVSKAIRKNKQKGLKTDFWHLELPKETRSYVPKLIALSQLIATPQRYNIDLYPVPNAPYFDIVDTESQIDLAEAAAIAEVDINELYRLNPGFNRWATAPDGPHRLLIPARHSERFKSALATIPPNKRLHWVRHEVKKGESLLLLAKRYNTDADVIRQVNAIRGNMIRAGQKLLVPTASKSSTHYALSSEERLKRIYRQRTGGSGTKQIFHRVASGESFWTIARKYNVHVSEITKWNGLAPKDTIRPGQKLSIWIDSNHKAHGLQRDPVVRKVGYTVRRGDSLARIANKFNIRTSDILKWNSVDASKYLQPGQYLTLYVDITRGIN